MNRKRLGITLLTSLLALGGVAPSAFAWDGDRDHHGWDRGRGPDRDWRDDRRREWRDDRRHYDAGYREGYRDARWRDDRRDYYGYYRPAPRPYWSRGQRYAGPVYVVNDYYRYDVRRPPYGYRWQRDDAGNLLLVAIATGIIADIVLNH